MTSPDFLLRKGSHAASPWLLYEQSNASRKHKTCAFGYIRFPQRKDKHSIPALVLFDCEAPKKIQDPDEVPVIQSAFTRNSFHFKFPSKEHYLRKAEKLLQEIQKGNIYEINFCVNFSAENAEINPVDIFKKLTHISDAPQACLAKFGSNWIMCSSPERFLKKQANKLITQPIKGTAARAENAAEDHLLKEQLYASIKERTENVMIVDVARHDLSQLAARGTVKTEELFGIYSFKQVHQMISTVSCELKQHYSLQQMMDATFPMASMTGAPKTRALQLINEYEDFDREFYSGSLGVVEENGDFDFNVLIRSIFWNAETKRLSFAVGSAITAMAEPEQEWEECMLKAKAMMEVLGLNYK